MYNVRRQTAACKQKPLNTSLYEPSSFSIAGVAAHSRHEHKQWPCVCRISSHVLLGPSHIQAHKALLGQARASSGSRGTERARPLLCMIRPSPPSSQNNQPQIWADKSSAPLDTKENSCSVPENILGVLAITGKKEKRKKKCFPVCSFQIHALLICLSSF